MKKKKALLTVIIFLVLILVAFVGVYAYITLDIFRTPKELFGKYLNNQIEQAKNIDMGALKTISDNLKTTTSETQYNMQIEDEDTDSVREVKLSFKADPINSISMLTFNINNDDEEFANYSIYADKEKVGISIPELNEKYFSIEINKMLEKVQDYAKENNLIENDNLELSTESIEKYKNEFKTLYNKYLEEIKTNFTDDDKFSAEKNVEVDVNGTTISANRYTFSITGTEIVNIATDVTNQISEEEVLLDFMTKDQISNLKEKMLEYLDMIDTQMTLKVCVYENSGTAIKVEIQTNDEIVAEFMIVKPSDTETNVIANMFYIKENEGEVGKTQSILYSVNVEDANTTTVTTTSSVTYNKEDIKALEDYYTQNDIYYDVSIEEEYEDTSTTQKVTTTLNGETATSKLSTKALEDLGYEVSKMQINYSFGSQVTFDTLDDTIDLGDYLDDAGKMSELLIECTQNLQDNPNTLLGSLFAIYSSFGNITPTMQDSYDDEDVSDYYTVDFKKEEIEELVTDAIDDCLESYQRDLEEDENTNISDYLTVNKISEMMLSSLVTDIEFVDGATIKCIYDSDTYYISLVINADTLEVDEATAYTESEYEDM